MERVLLGKIEIIERCVKRIRERVKKGSGDLLNDFDTQDVVVVNLQRACQATIDIAIYIIRKKQLGLPQVSSEAFRILAKNKIISDALSDDLQKMVGFRNIAVHEYQELNMSIVKSIVDNKLGSFSDFTKAVVRLL
ncbi:MAG: hypothetical protein A3E84_00800 [Gammaproteobacteria bacterium RIFCSPHIGHO2_12_FULL_42_13]|nr:MAG: hypothetical protein A3E84_00800 [Gammaproteobacteria bacterium RIFCSPHIGHO2_12_FULL_42_13]